MPTHCRRKAMENAGIDRPYDDEITYHVVVQTSHNAPPSDQSAPPAYDTGKLSAKLAKFALKATSKLADRLTSEYCNEDKVYAVIFDNRKLARDSFYLEDYVRTRGKLIQMRGFYTLDRSTGKVAIEFSTKFGNPTTEIQIDLSSN